MKTVNTTHTNRKAQGAFTLVELLVVIAIIAVLTAILVPVFLRVRENARRSTCQSNLQQLGMGLLQYAHDYDGKFMYQWNGHNSYKEILQPYVKSRQIWVCPSNPRNNEFPTVGTPQADVGVPPIPISYAANRRIVLPDGSDASISLSFIKEPVRKIAISDSNYWLSGVDPGQYKVKDISELEAGDGYLLFAGHISTINCLFLDGHVKALKPTAMATPVNMWGTMGDNTGGSDCDTSSNLAQDLGINCNQVSPGQLRYFKNVEAFYG